MQKSLSKKPDLGEERREYQRCTLKNGACAGRYPNIGEIVDISLGGVLFHYLDIGGLGAEKDELIVCGDAGRCLSGLKHSVISDKVLESQSSFSKIVVRERRIKFEEMSEEQKKILSNFILVHSVNRGHVSLAR